MKVSLNWLRDYVELPHDMDLKRLAYDLTMSTVEVEDATDLGASFHDMVVGEIREVLPHPNADKLRICRTDIGGGTVKEIVCGGSNLRDGMKVAVALPGSVCRWHGEGEPVEIHESKLRGVASYGMICGAVEIGLADLFPAEGEAVILDLSAFDAPAGTPLADALDLNDIILEIDNKSMTNRPDLWGHYGIARELAALYHLPMKTFPHFDRNVENTAGFRVTVEDTERCPRYLSAQIEGFSVKAAPYQMQSRIWRVGMRPINALVDITNYVMLATGLVHGTPIQMVYAFLMGLAFGFLRRRTGSILPGFAAHAAFNAMNDPLGLFNGTGGVGAALAAMAAVGVVGCVVCRKGLSDFAPQDPDRRGPIL